jgi:nucleotide-binding universal stress UspA family protein
MVFERILVGFDGTPASERALTEALALRAPKGRLEAVTVAETHYATHAGMDATAWAAELRVKAEAARSRAMELLDGVDYVNATVTTGYAAPALLRAAEALDADLIAVGAHGHSRVAEILLGSVAARIVHDAPCAVLVARGEPGDLIVIESAGAEAERAARKARSSVLIGARARGRAEQPGPAPRATAGRS